MSNYILASTTVKVGISIMLFGARRGGGVTFDPLPPGGW